MGLKTSLQTFAYKSKYAITDHSSQILTGASIVGSVGAFGFAVFACVKKLPDIQAKFEEDVRKIEETVTNRVKSSKQELDLYTQDEILAVISDPGEDEETIRNREHMLALQDVVLTGPQLEAAAYTKARLVRAGRVFVVFLPALLCLGGSIAASLTLLSQMLKAAAIAGATIAGLTAELAATRSDHQALIGDKAMAERDHDNAVSKTGDEDAPPNELLRKQLYTRIYTDHLIMGMDTDACLKDARSDLANIERLKNELFQRRKRMYFGDILKALYYETCECGQNTGWIVRDYPSDYDGRIDFGCWLNPGAESDMLILNPACINEDGSIVLNFNVEGPVEWMLQEAKKQSALFRSRDIPSPVIPAQLLPASI